MKIGFAFTNYNNSYLSIQAVRSIVDSAFDCEVDIVIVDNASSKAERLILSDLDSLPSCCFVHWNETNVGYFDGLNIGMDILLKRNSDLDAIVIGNNDLVFDHDFFINMKARLQTFGNYSVICPSIITLDREHQNPHVVSGIGRMREIIWDVYFSSFFVAQLIGFFAKLARPLVGRKDHHAHTVERFIYSGYGACYILTPRFFRLYERLWSPGFLMGEEFYLTRQLAAKGDRMYFIPDILVRHHDHATVSKLPSINLWKMTRQYHRIYRFFINPYRIRMDNGKTPDDYDRYFSSKL